MAVDFIKMIRSTSVLVLSAVIICEAIDQQPVKVTLSQKANAQFLRYDSKIPPLKEFTVCLWVRFFDFVGDHSIFTYMLNGDRLIGLWLESGGRHVKVSFNELVSSSFPVSVTENMWHHMCLSYQADYGAWAFYMDSSLVSCGAAQTLYDFVIPGGGTILIGYGTSSGEPSDGLEGEIYGVNMMLFSTIERNHTANNSPQRIPKKIRDMDNNEYKFSRHFHSDGIQNNVKGAIFSAQVENMDTKNNNVKGFVSPPNRNKTKSHIRIKSPNNLLDHDIGLDLLGRQRILSGLSNDEQFFDMYSENEGSAKVINRTTKDNNKNQFPNFVDHMRQVGIFEAPQKAKEQSSSSTRDLPTISEFETPPPASSAYTVYEENKLALYQPPLTESFYKIPEDASMPPKTQFDKSFKDMNVLSEMEQPPPPQKNKEVYGQWTSSKYAGTVLNYLKSIKFYKKDKKVPRTIPLHKASDSFPYASDLKVSMVVPPYIPRKGREIGRPFQPQYPAYPFTKHLTKRQVAKPEINVAILEDDVRDDILLSHAQTKPKHVEVISRGEVKKNGKDHRFYRNIQIKKPIIHDEVDGSSLAESTIETNNPTFQFDQNQSNQMKLPFLKSVEYFTGYEDFKTGKNMETKNNMYTKSLLNDNMWHNVKLSNIDYTPRKVDIKENGQAKEFSLIDEINKNHPFIQYLYKFGPNKTETSDYTSLKGVQPTIETSNHRSNHMNKRYYDHDHQQNGQINTYMYSNEHGSKRNSPKRKIGQPTYAQDNNEINEKVKNFNKSVKIGNALSEKHLIGVNTEQKRQSFEGGFEWIPDIQRYRSESGEDSQSWRVPPSLSHRVCSNIDGHQQHVLYIQPDESIALTKIPSHSKDINTPIHFIMQNYKECSLEESVFDTNHLLLLQWNKTPVRIFGGGSTKATTDLCGFF